MGSEAITSWHLSFGIRLRQARERARYSTRQISALVEDRYQLQLSHGSLARIERGEQRISVGLLGVLCDLYRVAPIEVLVGAKPAVDAPWLVLARAGLEQRVVAGIVWAEQMLDHGSAAEPDAASDDMASP